MSPTGLFDVNVQQAPPVPELAGGDLRRVSDPSRAWAECDQPAIDWVIFSTRELPTMPFELRDGEFVFDVAKYFTCLHRDIERGPLGPCSGSVVRDCRRLKEIADQLRTRVIPH